jgi:hypothetical protein
VDRRAHPVTLELEAHNPTDNHHRAYVLDVGQDLLRHWVVTLRFGRAGRTGRGGHVLTYAVADREAARRFVRARLKRRLTARRRIGCAYRLTRATVGEGEDLAAWVPMELLARDGA